jgi:hypothetical protein
VKQNCINCGTEVIFNSVSGKGVDLIFYACQLRKTIDSVPKMVHVLLLDNLTEVLPFIHSTKALRSITK